MLNDCVLMGRLTKDPEMRRTGSGIPVTSFTIAVDRDFVEKGQEKATDFIDVVAWRGTAEFVSKYFSKGRMAVVSGRLQIRNWTDQNGSKRRNAEIVAENVYFGDTKREGGEIARRGIAPQDRDVEIATSGLDAPPRNDNAGVQAGQGKPLWRAAPAEPRNDMRGAGVPVYPGSDFPVMEDDEQLPLPWETGGVR